jgi:hypothetical protein
MKVRASLAFLALLALAMGLRDVRAEDKPPTTITMGVKYQPQRVVRSGDLITSMAKTVTTDLHEALGKLMKEENYKTTTATDHLLVEMSGELSDPATDKKDADKRLRAAAHKVAKDHHGVKVDSIYIHGLE